MKELFIKYTSSLEKWLTVFSGVVSRVWGFLLGNNGYAEFWKWYEFPGIVESWVEKVIPGTDHSTRRGIEQDVFADL